MQKIYVLLRNNQQTGPYNLEELLRFNLKPYDLIWIQGKSSGWYYPQEIKALHPYLSFLKKSPQTAPAPQKAKAEDAPATKPFVAMPANFVKEEPTPQPSFKTTDFSFATPKENDGLEAVVYQYKKTETKPTPTPQPKTKKQPVFSTSGVVIACLLVGVLGWFIIKPLSDESEVIPEQTAAAPVQNEINPDNTSSSGSAQINKASSKKQKQRKEAAVKNIAVKQTTTIAKQPTDQHKEVVIKDMPAENNRDETTPSNKEDKVIVEEKKNERVVTEAPTEQKKKLRDKILDLFKKKPQDNKEETKPAEEEGGERRSTRREADLSRLVSVHFTIPNNWMMGIKGAKAALTNRSSETIAKATIELLYYNDDNELLDKKIISFGKVEAKSSQTISIPDHATATKVDYTILSVTGAASQPFARL